MRRALALPAAIAAVLAGVSASAELGESHFPALPSAEQILAEARGAARTGTAPATRPLALRQAAPGQSLAQRIDAPRLLRHLETISADEMVGRRTGSDGNAKARAYIIGEFASLGLQPFGSSYEMRFGIANLIPGYPGYEVQATNIVAFIRGTSSPDRYLVISAHYDHMGQQGEPQADKIYNGADDDASGSAGILALAAYLRANPPAHSVIFLLSDAEEWGAYGAKFFLSQPPVPISSLALHLNLDMIARDDKGGLHIIGGVAQPQLGPWLDLAASRARVNILPGDLAMDSEFLERTDSGPFHAQGVPTLTFYDGSHEDYHKVTDEFSKIDRPFYIDAVETVLEFVLEADRNPPVSRAVALHPAMNSPRETLGEFRAGKP